MAEIIVVYEGNKPVGSAIWLTFVDYAENPWFGTVQDCNRKYVSYLLHHEMIMKAVRADCRIYSFGRSTRGGSGHQYKKQWKGEDMPLLLNATHSFRNNLVFYRHFGKVAGCLPAKMMRSMDRVVAKYIY